MHVSALVWTITVVTTIVIFVVDLLIVGRRPHEPSMRETAIWVGVYVVLAVVFGVVLVAAYGPRYGGEFFAGWLTEYSLSVDNLFVFVIIMARFAVPRVLQQKVLLIGVMLALLMRGALIVLQSILAVAFGAGLFIAFEQLWKWNGKVALGLSVLVILGLVAAVRIVRKTEDMASTLTAVAVGFLVTCGPLALLQSH